MSTLKEKLDYIKETKRQIGEAITAKGGSVTDNFRDFATAITNLPSGGGSANIKAKSSVIVSNGTFYVNKEDPGMDGWSSVEVNVPQSGTANIQPKTTPITQKGIYNADKDGVDGWSSVEVNMFDLLSTCEIPGSNYWEAQSTECDRLYFGANNGKVDSSHLDDFELSVLIPNNIPLVPSSFRVGRENKNGFARLGNSIFDQRANSDTSIYYFGAFPGFYYDEKKCAGVVYPDGKLYINFGFIGKDDRGNTRFRHYQKVKVFQNNIPNVTELNVVSGNYFNLRRDPSLRELDFCIPNGADVSKITNFLGGMVLNGYTKLLCPGGAYSFTDNRSFNLNIGYALSDDVVDLHIRSGQAGKIKELKNCVPVSIPSPTGTGSMVGAFEGVTFETSNLGDDGKYHPGIHPSMFSLKSNALVFPDRCFARCSGLYNFKGDYDTTGKETFTGSDVFEVDWDLSKATCRNFENTFFKCSFLSKVNIAFPPGAPIVLDSTFMDCRELTSVTFTGDPEFHLANVYKSPFYRCAALTTIPQMNLVYNEDETSSFLFAGTGISTMPEWWTPHTREDSTFDSCPNLATFPLIECGNMKSLSNFFGTGDRYVCPLLTTFGGFKDLGKSFDSNDGVSDPLTGAPNLTVESLNNVVTNLYDMNLNPNVASGLITLPIKFAVGQANFDKCTPEIKSAALTKGWQIAVDQWS